MSVDGGYVFEVMFMFDVFGMLYDVCVVVNEELMLGGCAAKRRLGASDVDSRRRREEGWRKCEGGWCVCEFLLEMLSVCVYVEMIGESDFEVILMGVFGARGAARC